MGGVDLKGGVEAAVNNSKRFVSNAEPDEPSNARMHSLKTITARMHSCLCGMYEYADTHRFHIETDNREENDVIKESLPRK